MLVTLCNPEYVVILFCETSLSTRAFLYGASAYLETFEGIRPHGYQAYRRDKVLVTDPSLGRSPEQDNNRPSHGWTKLNQLPVKGSGYTGAGKPSFGVANTDPESELMSSSHLRLIPSMTATETKMNPQSSAVEPLLTHSEMGYGLREARR